MKTNQELCEAADQVIDGLFAGTLTPVVATEINNAIGKRVSIEKNELLKQMIEHRINRTPAPKPLTE